VELAIRQPHPSLQRRRRIVIRPLFKRADTTTATLMCFRHALIILFVGLACATTSYGQNAPDEAQGTAKAQNIPESQNFSKDKPLGPPEIKITSSQGAVFDSNAKTAIFKGEVIVTHPSFTLTSDQLIVYINQDSTGLERAVATGYVTIRKENLASDGKTKSIYIGKARKATFKANEQTVTLTDWPQVQKDDSLHIATERDAVMILNRDGTLTTKGSSRTVVPERTP